MGVTPLENIPVVTDRFGWPWNEQTPGIGDWPDKLPKISIITPSFNQGIYLEETIRSVLAQKYPNYELIIIDAGSTDSTLDVIRKYEPWITYWVSERDRGQSHAIQKGLAVATGDIINWINSDDLLAPGALHRIAAEFNLDTHDVLCGYCDYFVRDLNHLDLRNERMGLGQTVGDTILGGKINQPSTFFKASVIKELGVDEQFHFTMDLDLWFRYLLRAGQSRILLSESLLTYFRLHEASKTVALSPRFDIDIRKVMYNIFFSLNQPVELLDFMRLSILDEKFVPTRYPVKIPAQQLSSLIRKYAWNAVIHYNERRNRNAARVCLTVARQNGWPINRALVRQWIKQYLLPESLVR